jgi:hypothetical protein
MADWTYGTPRDEHLDEHNQYDHVDLLTLVNGKLLGVVAGIIKQVDAPAGGGPGSDTTAIHESTAAEISAVTAKATPTSADFLLIEDAAAADAKKRITIGDLPDLTTPHVDVDAVHDNVNSEISAVTLKGTPVSADMILIEDSGASNAKKRITVGSLPTGGGGGGLDVTELSANTTLTASGVYVVDTSGGNRTITLPILSGSPAEGYRIQVIRDGANFVYVEPNAADDYWDATAQRTLFDPYAAVSVAVGSTGTSWLELGRWRTVT